MPLAASRPSTGPAYRAAGRLLVQEPRRCELYIVEGNSAGGSAKEAAIPARWPSSRSRGKILNVERARIDKMLKNTEIQALIGHRRRRR